MAERPSARANADALLRRQGAIAFLEAVWSAPVHVRTAVTLRGGGVSAPPFDSLNLAAHVGDDPAAVAQNLSQLAAALRLPSEPLWLSQVHGIEVARPGDKGVPVADASVAFEPGQVLSVLTADCLPVLFADRAGTRVGAAHAGWKGLLAGVLEATVKALDAPPGELLAWMGPAIGPNAFEVGPEVRDAFIAVLPGAAEAFVPGEGDRWLGDMYLLARQRLSAAGVGWIGGGGACTCTDASDWFSYRRDERTGRMASLIWLEPSIATEPLCPPCS